ncbi:MAG: glycosyltransferase family 39 protein [Dehalococcoidia bacterium]
MTTLDATGLRPPRVVRLNRGALLRWGGLTAVVLVAAWLRFANLGSLGYANHYYAAGVESMLQSWQNFFFVAAEPGGSVTIDKPPVGLWLQAASAAILGVNGFALVLPQIVAGLLSVVVVSHLVGRSFGSLAGLIAALVVAITPVTVATDRNNTIDSTLILTLLLATWAFIKATETARLGWLLIGATLVGVGFNIKMLQAYLPLPAFFALYFAGAPERWWRKLGKLAITGVLLLVVSLSWAVAVDLTPADQRPYIGSSEDNSVMSLIVGHNGLRRLVGMRQGGFLGGLFGGLAGQQGAPAARPGGAPQAGQPPMGPPPAGPRGPAVAPGAPGQPGRAPGQVPGQPGQPGRAPGQAPVQNPPASSRPPGGPIAPGPQLAPGGGGPGGFAIGTPGVLRMFVAPLSKEASWLIPFAFAGVLVLLLRDRPRWPLGSAHRAAVLWGGWLVIGVAFFSIANLFHEYYLAMLAPPVGALIGSGAVELWRSRPRWLAAVTLFVITAGTLGYQIVSARAFLPLGGWWEPVAGGLLLLGVALALGAAAVRRPALLAAGFVAALAAVLLTPAIWSGLTTLYASGNQSLPSAYGGRPSGPPNRGSLQVNQALLDYLQTGSQGMKYLMAVPSSMQGADYVLATGRPVLYLGGFSGNDRVVTTEQLAALVAAGDLRYIYWGGGRSGPGGGSAELTGWVTSACRSVKGFETATVNAGAPDGTVPGGNPPPGGAGQAGPNPIQVTLYDCRPG